MIQFKRIAYSEVQIRISALFRARLGSNSVLAREHLNECMTLLTVDNAGLHCSEMVEDVTQFRLGNTRLKVRNWTVILKT